MSRQEKKKGNLAMYTAVWVSMSCKISIYKCIIYKSKIINIEIQFKQISEYK